MSHVLTCVETLLFFWHLIKSALQWCFYLDVSAICGSNCVWKSENGVKCWFLFLPDVNFCTGTECSLRPGKFQHPTLPAWSSSSLAEKCQMCQCPKNGPCWTGVECAEGRYLCILSHAPTKVQKQGMNPGTFFLESITCWEAWLCSR